MYQIIPWKSNTFLKASSEFLCPTCKNGSLTFRDYCKRIIRHEGGTHEWIKIPRHQCSNPQCGRLHRMIPDILVPFKHYDEETIAGVIDGVVGPDDEDSENAPCEATMNRWHHWMMMNRFDVEGQLKSIGYRLLGFGEELLKSGSSLLDQMRRSIPGEWFKKMLRCIYNSGGVLRPFYG